MINRGGEKLLHKENFVKGNRPLLFSANERLNIAAKFFFFFNSWESNNIGSLKKLFLQSLTKTQSWNYELWKKQTHFLFKPTLCW